MLVRVGVVGGPSERRLPSRALQKVSSAFNYFPQSDFFLFLAQNKCRITVFLQTGLRGKKDRLVGEMHC